MNFAGRVAAEHEVNRLAVQLDTLDGDTLPRWRQDRLINGRQALIGKAKAGKAIEEVLQNPAGDTENVEVSRG